MLAARPRTLRARVSVPADAEGHAWSELEAHTRARFGRANLIGAAPWVSRDHGRGLYGALIPIPGTRVVRWLVGVRGQLVVTAGVGEGETAPIEAGDAIGWDLDRDPVQISSGGPWTALAVDFAVGPLARRRAPLPPDPVAAWFVDHVGAANATYTLLAVAASAAAASITPLVAATSFVHYAIYIATYARGRGVAYGEFLRDAVYFKTLSMACLAGIVAANPPWSPLGFAMIVAGVALSVRAAQVLGMERTYFGVELGRVPPERIDRFPYGALPHPMILGAVVALVGVGLQPGVRATWPWLAPAHVVAYSLHLVQEVLASMPRRRHPTAFPHR